MYVPKKSKIRKEQKEIDLEDQALDDFLNCKENQNKEKNDLEMQKMLVENLIKKLD